MILILRRLKELAKDRQPKARGRSRESLEEAIREIDLAITELRDLNRPRPPIHARICRILILLGEGGVYEESNESRSYDPGGRRRHSRVT